MDITLSELHSIQKLARLVDVPTDTLLAVIQVESNGRVYTVVDGRKEPLIRFEGHYFYRFLSGAERDQAVKEGLASPHAGKIKNPRSQADRYKLLARARAIDEDAANMSCSWGVGQVMGSHWQALSFTSVDQFIEAVRSGIHGQVDVMVRYIQMAGLKDELQRHDWAGFARGYNGPNYRKYGYDTKLKTCYEHFARKASPVSPASGMLRMGSKGKRVRELQRLLGRAGFRVAIDGDFGPATRNALKLYQLSQGLANDGIAGPVTMRSLSRFRADPSEDVGATPLADTLKGGAVSAGGGVSIAVAADKISQIADKIGSTGVQWLDTAVAGLYAVSGLLVIGGLAYSAYRYFESNKTFEGAS